MVLVIGIAAGRNKQEPGEHDEIGFIEESDTREFHFISGIEDGGVL
jgi:hypothetical protein